MTQIRIAGCVNDSIVDGPGLRYTIFTQGCPHHCNGCHNPETWDVNGGKIANTEDILRQISTNPLLSGVTFSGGEPFIQAEALAPLAHDIKGLGLELAIYTGFTFEHLLSLNNADINALLSYADVLIDGKFDLSQRSLALDFKGSSNQRTIDVPKSLKKGKVILEKSERWNPSQYAI